MENAFFALVFTKKISLQKSQVLETREILQSKENVLLVVEDQVRANCTCMGPEEIHAGVLRDLADVIGRPLLVIFHQTW